MDPVPPIQDTSPQHERTLELNKITSLDILIKGEGFYMYRGRGEKGYTST